MRIVIFMLLITCSPVQVRADSPYLFTDSGTADNICARIYYLTRGSTNLSATEKINLCFLTKTNEGTAPIVYFPKPEYFCNAQLLNSNGIVVPKTSMGERYGSKFLNLNAYSWDAVSKRGRNTGGDRYGMFGGSDKPEMTILHTNVAEGHDLPSVQELFKISDSGNYKLSLHFQVFKRIGNGTNHTFKVVRIPPIEIPIVKE
jgi:hypothetical protein